MVPSVRLGISAWIGNVAPFVPLTLFGIYISSACREREMKWSVLALTTCNLFGNEYATINTTDQHKEQLFQLHQRGKKLGLH